MPNPLGLYDVYGNVLEMCLLLRHGRNAIVPFRETSPAGQTVVASGGSFLTHAMYATSSSEFRIRENIIDQNIGFRIAFTLIEDGMPRSGSWKNH